MKVKRVQLGVRIAATLNQRIKDLMIQTNQNHYGRFNSFVEELIEEAVSRHEKALRRSK